MLDSARATYQQQGYLFPLPILSDREVADARAAIDAMEAQLGRERMSVPLKHQHLERPEIWRLATHPRVLDAVAAVLGPDVVLASTSFFIKYPEPAAERDRGSWYVGWHQDVTYWGFDPPLAASVWLAIDDADADNGCMRFVPGSHRRGILPHGKAHVPGNILSVNQDIAPEHFDPASAVDVALRAGEASLHDGLLIHGSNPNRSDRRRCGLTAQFTTPAVGLTGAMSDFWKPILVHGADRHARLPLTAPPPFARG